MASFLLGFGLLVIVLYVSVNDVVPCNCAETETECAEMFGLRYDNDGNVVTKCGWWEKRDKCKNADFVDCDGDDECIWIKKTEEMDDEDEGEDLMTTTEAVDQCD